MCFIQQVALALDGHCQGKIVDGEAQQPFSKTIEKVFWVLDNISLHEKYVMESQGGDVFKRIIGILR